MRDAGAVALPTRAAVVLPWERVLARGPEHERVNGDATRAADARLAEAVGLAKEVSSSLSLKQPSPLLQILPDTYHMNIEEVNTAAELCKYISYFDSIHFSDNNRFLPGYGAIDFKEIVTALIAANFSGYIGLEGNFKDLAQDIALFCDLFSVIERGIK